MKYYLDADNGSDKNSGTSPEQAWKTIERANGITYKRGDTLYLKRGCEWKGMLVPAGDGTQEEPIMIDAYGEGEMPCVDGDGAWAAIYLCRVEHWVVQNIRCVNRAKERRIRCGIAVEGKREGISRGYTIRNCEITEVYGENRRGLAARRNMYWNGAIFVTIPCRCTKENHLDGVLIENNSVHDVLNCGIRVFEDEDFVNDLGHTNVIVRGNRVERTGADAILVANCDSPIIEHNRCYDAGALGTLEDTRLIAGIWVCGTRNALIQYNEVARTRLFENDGTAFDTDWGTSGTTVFRYNYTHENEGGFWLDCTALNRHPLCEGTHIYGNVSVNDRFRIVSQSMGIQTIFEDNLFINTEDVEICNGGSGEAHSYSRNVFALAHAPKSGWGEAEYSGNSYTGAAKNAEDADARTASEEFIELARSLKDLDGKEKLFGLNNVASYANTVDVL